MRLQNIFKMHTVFHKIYHSPSVEERIQLFQQLGPNVPCITEFEVSAPSFIKESTAKDILNFVSHNNITNNVRIIHALTHIQYNAFMSYADTLLRFASQTQQYEQDFRQDMRSLALEEASHYVMLRKRLLQLQYDYGHLPVIPKLSKAINDTQDSLIARICVISLIHEGHGVRAVQKLISQLQRMGDNNSVTVVRQIQKDEVKHLQMGWKWLKRVCEVNSQPIQKVIDQVNKQFKSNIRIPSKSV